MAEGSGPAQGIPAGLKLIQTLSGHEGHISSVAFSRDGTRLASRSADGTVRVWEAATGRELARLEGRVGWMRSMAVSPEGRRVALGSNDGTMWVWEVETGQKLVQWKGHEMGVGSITYSLDGRRVLSGSADSTVRVWEAETGRELARLEGHEHWVFSVDFSPECRRVASGAADSTVRVWEVATGEELARLEGHGDWVYTVAFSPDGHLLASGSEDRTVRVWEAETGKELARLEGHDCRVGSVAFSPKGRVLASKSIDGTIRLWRGDTWEMLAVVNEPPASLNWFSNLAFHPNLPILATLGEEDRVVRIWELEYDVLLGAARAVCSSYYTNAKAVLVGDTGVGKTGLGLVLTGKPFEPTESTHARNVWTFASEKVALDEKREQTRETLLWDLAGQPAYRLVHQLHLNEVAAALVVFDARSETDPLAGVKHWDRALRQAQRLQGDGVPPIRKFLVFARGDRGTVAISRERLEALTRDLGYDGYFETSAKEGWGVAELAAALRGAIAWEALPLVVSNKLFEQIKAFLLEEKQAGRLLSTADDLYRAFLKSADAPKETEGLRASFDTCIRLVESRDLIRRLSFGDFVLLQPEWLDAYASAMVNAARDEPQGMGCIPEDEAREGQFRLPEAERIADRAQEKLLLIATVEDLLRHEIALKEQADDATYLIVPSQFTRDYPAAPEPEGQAVIFSFEGPVLNVYATLCVRLAHSGLFTKADMWRNAALYTADVGGQCGLWLRDDGEGHAELTLFFDEAASEETRFHFEEYVRTHLMRRALPETVQRRRIFRRPVCGEAVTDRQAQRRRALGFDWMTCNVCPDGVRISLLDREERLVTARDTAVMDMDRSADAARDVAAAASVIAGKIATGDFDVFLCHNSADKPAVKEIGNRLKARGILPWLDEWELRPGLLWQSVLEQQIESIRSVAVFVGASGIGPWQNMESEAFVREFVGRGCPVISVLLPDALDPPVLPVSLRDMTWVDFRKTDPDPIDQLVWGITGERPMR